MVATAAGISIDKRDVLDVWSLISPTFEVYDAVQLALGYKIARKEAQTRGFKERPGDTTISYVNQFLESAFSPQSSCHTIDETDIAKRVEEQKRRYHHPDIFHVVDAQHICCPKDNAPCVGDSDAENCFVVAQPKMEKAFVFAKSVTKDKHSFESAVQATISGDFSVSILDYRFAYDFSESHHAQKGSWVVMDPAIIHAVRYAKPGDVLAPVKSEYGIHLLYVLERRTKSSGNANDPAVATRVRADLCAEILSRVRHRYLMDLCQGYTIELQPGAIDTLNKHRPKLNEFPNEPKPDEPKDDIVP